jgi:hypothetical protein
MSSENFIRVYDGLFSEDYCKSAIEQFKFADASGMTYQRQEYSSVAKSTIDDLSVVPLEFCKTEMEYGMVSHSKTFSDIFWNTVYPKYTNEFPHVNSGLEQHTVNYIKIQRTLPGQGYHVWHAECQGRKHTDRILAFILYLNKVTDGGETEFLYQNMRVNPLVGRLLIFPAHFTHLHRGNPPLKGEKFILTGWVQFV